MRPASTLRVTCAGCQVRQVQPTASILAMEHDGVLLIMFACFICGTGHQEVSSLVDRTNTLASGAAVRRWGETGWPTRSPRHPPDRPAAPPRPAPLSRLARMVQRLKLDEGDR